MEYRKVSVASVRGAVSPDTPVIILALFPTPAPGVTDVIGFLHGLGHFECPCIGLFGVRSDGASTLRFGHYRDEYLR